MKTQDQYLVFTIDEERYAMALSAVEKVIRTVELTLLPKAPGFLLGLINMKGKAIPVLDIRKRYNLPDREMRLDDRIIISQTLRGTIAIIVNTVERVVEFPQEQLLEAQEILPEMGPYVEGVGKLDGDMIPIYDLDNLFPIQDMKRLEDVMKRQGGASA